MIGNFFKTRSHYVFDYKPRYYDERKERIESLKKKYEKEGDDDDDIKKITLSKDQLRQDWARHKKSTHNRNVNIRLAIIIAILVGLAAYIFELHKLF
ncbi:MAG: hypothetical protein ABFR05_05690 [Bacteroidota bacterium]